MKFEALIFLVIVVLVQVSCPSLSLSLDSESTNFHSAAVFDKDRSLEGDLYETVAESQFSVEDEVHRFSFEYIFSKIVRDHQGYQRFRYVIYPEGLYRPPSSRG